MNNGVLDGGKVDGGNGCLVLIIDFFKYGSALVPRIFSYCSRPSFVEGGYQDTLILTLEKYHGEHLDIIFSEYQ